MMTSYQEYIAVLKRMKEIEAKGTAELFYYHCSTSGHSQACQDKATIYDSEHDQTPASVEWLKTLPLEYFGEAAAWSFTSGLVCVGGLYLREPETFMNIGKQPLGRNPTRGDVLTALRLFKKEGA